PPAPPRDPAAEAPQPSWAGSEQREASAGHDATRPLTSGWTSGTGYGQSLPWSSPGAGAAPPEAQRPSAPAYPPSAPPAEFTTAGGSAASPAAEPYAWRDPAARPWQSPAGYPPPEHQPAERPRRGRRSVGTGGVVLLVLVALLGGTVLGALGARWLWPPSTSSSSLPAPSNPAATTRPPDSVAGIASAALESTV